MDTLKVRNFGPIGEANVEFGDLTLLVGPQASGKSVFLQLLKLIQDVDFIRNTVEANNYVWNGNTDNILNLYFGDGMSSIWSEDTVIGYDNNKIGKKYLQQKSYIPASIGAHHKLEQLFYVPAQRVLSLSNGSPKGFMDFDDAVPYVLRQFSDLLRRMLTHKNWDQELQFPRVEKKEDPLIDLFKENIFQDGKIFFDARRGQKKFSMQLSDMNLPFMTWSSGQKEFLPLLISFYWLLDAKKLRDNIRYIVIEEPEMGLHPQAIKLVILRVVNLITRGYKVIISTHSPVFLEFVWAFQMLKASDVNEDALLDLFEIKKTTVISGIFNGIMAKDINTYYFNRQAGGKVRVLNISSLDAGSENHNISEWGGLSSFATRAGEIVSKNIQL